MADSREAPRQRAEAGPWRLQDGMTLATAEAALRLHRQALAGAGEVIKDDARRRVSRVQADGRSLVVKEFVDPGRWWRRRDRRTWAHARRLLGAELPVAQVLAWRREPERGFVLFADVGPKNAWQLLWGNDAGALARSKARTLLRDLAACSGRFHAAGVFPKDLNLTNFVPLARPAGDRWQPLLVDLDYVAFGRRSSWWRRARGLRSALRTIHTKRGRLEYVAHYLQQAELGRRQWFLWLLRKALG